MDTIAKYRKVKTDYIFLCLLLLGSCSPSIKDEYKGYLFYDQKPLTGARVTEQYTENFTFTDSTGYFKLKRGNAERVNDLIIHTDVSEPADTIELIRVSGGAGGKSRDYLFLQNRKDTIDIKRERYFKQQIQSR